jgi:hypothetical protein
MERKELNDLFKAHVEVSTEDDYRRYIHQIQSIVSDRTKSTITFYSDEESEKMGHGPQEYVEPSQRALFAARMAIRVGSTPKAVFDAAGGLSVQVFNNFSKDESRAGDYDDATKTIRLGLLNEQNPSNGFNVYVHELFGHHLDAVSCGPNWGDDKTIRQITGAVFAGDRFNTKLGADQVDQLRVSKRYGFRNVYEQKATFIEQAMGPAPFGVNQESTKSRKIDAAQAQLFGRINMLLGSRTLEALAILNDGSDEGYFGLHPQALVERRGY